MRLAGKTLSENMPQRFDGKIKKINRDFTAFNHQGTAIILMLYTEEHNKYLFSHFSSGLNNGHVRGRPVIPA